MGRESNLELSPSRYLSVVAIIVQLNFKDSESIKLAVLKCVVKVSNWQCVKVCCEVSTLQCVDLGEGKAQTC